MADNTLRGRLFRRIIDSYRSYEEDAVSQWAPKVGTEAARHRAKARYLQIRVGTPVGIPTALLAWGGISTGNVVFIAVISLALLFVTSALVLSFIEILAYLRSAAAALHTDIGLFDDPPSDWTKYLDWCSRHGIEPYSAENRASNGDP